MFVVMLKIRNGHASAKRYPNFYQAEAALLSGVPYPDNVIGARVQGWTEFNNLRALKYYPGPVLECTWK